MGKVFKAYSKGYQSFDSDSIFSFMGRDEVGLTKSIASLLYHDDEFLDAFMALLGLNINVSNSTIFVFAEQLSQIINNQQKRRDITIQIKDSTGHITLIIVEAKNPINLINKNLAIISQLNDYFNPLYFPDVLNATTKIGVTLTSSTIKQVVSGLNFGTYYSLTWEDILIRLAVKKFKNSITNSFFTELKRMNFMKTYEKEIFCPAAGTSYNLISTLKIYCCPYDRKIKNSIYLMPRIGFNSYRNLLTPYGLNNDKYKGKGFYKEIYKIIDTFIVDSNSVVSIQDPNIQAKVIKWLNGRQEILKVFVLSDPIPFNTPKFTLVQNPRGNIYKQFREIL